MVDYTNEIKDYLNSKHVSVVFFTTYDIITPETNQPQYELACKRKSFSGWMRWYREKQPIEGWNISIATNANQTVLTYKATMEGEDKNADYIHELNKFLLGNEPCYTSEIEAFLDGKPTEDKAVFFNVYNIVKPKPNQLDYELASKRKSFSAWMRWYRTKQMITGWDISIDNNANQKVITYKAVREGADKTLDYTPELDKFLLGNEPSDYTSKIKAFLDSKPPNKDTVTFTVRDIIIPDKGPQRHDTSSERSTFGAWMRTNVKHQFVPGWNIVRLGRKKPVVLYEATRLQT